METSVTVEKRITQINIKFVWVFFLSGCLLLANVKTYGQQQDKGSLLALKSLNGKYPSHSKLFQNKAFNASLKKLLTTRFSFLKQYWAVETPIDIKNNMFSAWGCQQHNCSNTNFIIVVDFTKNVVYVGIREEEKIKVYSEDGSSNTIVSNWAKRIS